MYQKIKRLLDENKITPYQLSKQIGIAAASFTDWKKGKAKPSTNALRKIAEYFKISVSYFYENLENNEEKINEELDNQIINCQNQTIKEIYELLKKMTEEDRSHILSYSRFLTSQQNKS